jgi:hypothetical protein
MSFAESAILLVLTAVLTGLGVPYVKGRIDDRKLEKQKVFDDERLRAQTRYEAGLARQTKVIEAQAQLLDELAETLWGYQKMLLKITYYAVTGDKEKHRAAFLEYDDQSWDALETLLGLISKSRRLASVEVHDRLERLYWTLVFELDNEIISLSRKDADDGVVAQGWSQLQSRLTGDIRAEIDGVLADLAAQLRLSETTPEIAEPSASA